MAQELRGYLVGWREYYRLAETPSVFRDIDTWIRHRLRMGQLKQWKRGTTVYRALRARGVPELIARGAAAYAKREGFAENGYRVLMNCNRDGGQTVFHLHLHLLAGRALDAHFG